MIDDYMRATHAIAFEISLPRADITYSLIHLKQQLTSSAISKLFDLGINVLSQLVRVEYPLDLAHDVVLPLLAGDVAMVPEHMLEELVLGQCLLRALELVDELLASLGLLAGRLGLPLVDKLGAQVDHEVEIPGEVLISGGYALLLVVLENIVEGGGLQLARPSAEDDAPEHEGVLAEVLRSGLLPQKWAFVQNLNKHAIGLYLLPSADVRSHAVEQLLH